MCACPYRRDCLARQGIGALVERVANMTPEPMPSHLMAAAKRIQLLPEIGIFHRLLFRGAPAIALPRLYPFGDPVAEILAVGMQVGKARTLERLKGGDGGIEFHAVVRGVGFAALQLLHL